MLDAFDTHAAVVETDLNTDDLIALAGNTAWRVVWWERSGNGRWRVKADRISAQPETDRVTARRIETTHTMNKPRYRIELEPASGNYLAPPEKRLARLLKAMLRGYGWRCVACKPVAPAAQGQEGRQ